MACLFRGGAGGTETGALFQDQAQELVAEDFMDVENNAGAPPSHAAATTTAITTASAAEVSQVHSHDASNEDLGGMCDKRAAASL